MVVLVQITSVRIIPAKPSWCLTRTDLTTLHLLSTAQGRTSWSRTAKTQKSTWAVRSIGAASFMSLVAVHWQHKYPSWTDAHSSVSEHLLFSMNLVLVQTSRKRPFICVSTTIQLVVTNAEFRLVRLGSTGKSRQVFSNTIRFKSGVAQVISRLNCFI